MFYAKLFRAVHKQDSKNRLYNVMIHHLNTYLDYKRLKELGDGWAFNAN